MTVQVLDASAVFAYLENEPGAEQVRVAVSHGVALSTVNLAEVLSTAASRGAELAELAAQFTEGGLFEPAIRIEPFTVADAVEAARLRPLTRGAGLSLGDRACLALARRLKARVLTADRAWANVNVDVERTQIRLSP